LSGVVKTPASKPLAKSELTELCEEGEEEDSSSPPTREASRRTSLTDAYETLDPVPADSVKIPPPRPTKAKPPRPAGFGKPPARPPKKPRPVSGIEKVAKPALARANALSMVGEDEEEEGQEGIGGEETAAAEQAAQTKATSKLAPNPNPKPANPAPPKPRARPVSGVLKTKKTFGSVPPSLGGLGEAVEEEEEEEEADAPVRTPRAKAKKALSMVGEDEEEDEEGSDDDVLETDENGNVKLVRHLQPERKAPPRPAPPVLSFFL